MTIMAGDVPCPECDADASKPCRTADGYNHRRYPHKKRAEFASFSTSWFAHFRKEPSKESHVKLRNNP